MADPIDRCLERWHAHLKGELAGGLDEVLHPDCVFVSPIVFTPQRGREITKRYLTAAGSTLGATGSATGVGPGPVLDPEGPFRYVTEIRRGHHAMLEFETRIDDTWINGVDIITCDDESRIVEFKVMIRPLRAVTLVHERMRAMLEQFSD